MSQQTFPPGSLALTVVLGLLAALPPLSIDISIPTLLVAEADLHAAPGMIGQTITLFMVGFATGQLCAGPLSDHYGRRPVLLSGLGAYSVAALACGLPGTVGALIALRFVQGIAAGACAVLAFTIIRDLFEGEEARSKRSYVTVVFALAPMLAPTLGAWIMLLAGWRAIFLLSGLAGVLLLLVTAARFAESRPFGFVEQRIGPVHGYLSVLSDSRFAELAVLNALSYGSIFAYIAGSAGVIMGSLHYSAGAYAVFFASTAASLTAGAWVNGRSAKFGIGARRMLSIGLIGAAVTAVALCALLATDGVLLVLALPLLLTHLFCRGLIAPNAQHLALEPQRDHAGTATAAIGVMQVLTGAASSALVTVLLPRMGPQGMTLVMAALALSSLLLWFRITQRARRPA